MVKNRRKVGKIYSQILLNETESKVKIDQQIKNWNKIDHNIKTNNYLHLINLNNNILFRQYFNYY